MKTEEESGVERQLTFLESVAAAYASRYDEMSDICFLFPNKRAGTFFLKALAGNLGERPMLAPEVTGVSEFMARVSGGGGGPPRPHAARGRHYREIQSNFLTEEQCDVIERYFGYRPASENVERFWNSVGPEEER